LAWNGCPACAGIGVQFAWNTHYNAVINRYYQRKRAKSNGVVAIKTVAHKLARACYHMLREGTDFDVARAFA
jgi:hypothetical protein